MEFEISGCSVNCVRSNPDSGLREIITSFDAHLSAVPPHVHGRLTSWKWRRCANG